MTKKRKVREFSRKCQHVCSFEGANLQMAQWLSWLERRPVTAEVESSSLFWVVSIKLMIFSKVHKVWDLSSAGRASALQAEGHRFEPCRSHQYGWIPEWPKGADCKSVGNAFEGSNPSPSTYADVAQLAEQLICNQQVIGSSPIIGLKLIISRDGAVWKLVGLITRRS